MNRDMLLRRLRPAKRATRLLACGWPGVTQFTCQSRSRVVVLVSSWFGEDAMVPKRDILLAYKDMSAEKRRAFDGWLIGNFVIGSILAGGLFLSAVAGSGWSVTQHEAIAAST